MARIVIVGAGGVEMSLLKSATKMGLRLGKFGLPADLGKCDAIAADIKEASGVGIKTAQIDADNVGETVEFLKRVQPRFSRISPSHIRI